jgi:hypothetical protein
MRLHRLVAMTLQLILVIVTAKASRVAPMTQPLNQICRAKVTATSVATRITFKFGVSKVGKAHISVLEIHARYFPEGYC